MHDFHEDASGVRCDIAVDNIRFETLLNARRPFILS